MNNVPIFWKAPSPPANPKAYLEVCDLLVLAGGVGADVLVDFECREWLQQCHPGKSRRIFLYQDCFVSVVDRLTKSVWLRYLRSNSDACAQICFGAAKATHQRGGDGLEFTQSIRASSPDG